MDPDNTPALEPPPGVTPNFVDPYSDAPISSAITYLFFGIATVCLVLRLFARLKIMRQMQLEDYTLILGWTGFVIFEGFANTPGGFAAGRHQWDVSQTQMSSYLWYQNIATIVYCPAIVFTKDSVLVQLKRIFTTPHRGFIYWSIAFLRIVNAMFYTAAFVCTIIPCIPREKFWNPSVPGKCLNDGAVILISAMFNLCSDTAMLCLPIYAIWRLKMALRRKWGVTAIFATGALGCIASALRLYFSLTLIHDKDLTFVTTPVGVTSSVEFSSIIVIACFPVMPRLYSYLRSLFAKPRSDSEVEHRAQVLPPRKPVPRPATTTGDTLTCTFIQEMLSEAPTAVARSTQDAASCVEKEACGNSVSNEAWLVLDDSSSESSVDLASRRHGFGKVDHTREAC